MKRLVSAVLALSLLGTTAAVASPYRDGGFDNRDHYRGHDDGDGAAILAGVGVVALAAILASQHHHHHWHHGWYGNNDGRGYRDGYAYNGNYGYGSGYGYNAGYRYDRNGDHNRGYEGRDGDRHYGSDDGDYR